jgi:hypothetical protein
LATAACRWAIICVRPASRAFQSGSKLPQSKAARFARGLRLPPSLLVLNLSVRRWRMLAEAIYRYRHSCDQREAGIRWLVAHEKPSFDSPFSIQHFSCPGPLRGVVSRADFLLRRTQAASCKHSGPFCAGLDMLWQALAARCPMLRRMIRRASAKSALGLASCKGAPQSLA